MSLNGPFLEEKNMSKTVYFNMHVIKKRNVILGS